LHLKKYNFCQRVIQDIKIVKNTDIRSIYKGITYHKRIYKEKSRKLPIDNLIAKEIFLV